MGIKAAISLRYLLSLVSLPLALVSVILGAGPGGGYAASVFFLAAGYCLPPLFSLAMLLLLPARIGPLAHDPRPLWPRLRALLRPWALLYASLAGTLVFAWFFVEAVALREQYPGFFLLFMLPPPAFSAAALMTLLARARHGEPVSPRPPLLVAALAILLWSLLLACIIRAVWPVLFTGWEEDIVRTRIYVAGTVWTLFPCVAAVLFWMIRRACLRVSHHNAR